MSWFVSTHGVIPDQGNTEHSIVLLDNGQMWVLLTSEYQPVEGTWYSDSAFLYMIPSAGEAPIRMSGDRGQMGWRDYGEGDENDHPLMVAGKITDTALDAYQGGNIFMFSDGERIFINLLSQETVAGDPPYGHQWWVLNPETLDFAYTGTDSLANVYTATVIGDWIYYFESWGSTNRIKTLNTQTWLHGPDLFSSPQQLTSYRTSYNPATGMPHNLDDDHLDGPCYLTHKVGLDGHTYIYLFHVGDNDGPAIRRIDQQGGGISTLYWACGDQAWYNSPQLQNSGMRLPDTMDEHALEDVPDGYVTEPDWPSDTAAFSSSEGRKRWNMRATNPPRYRGWNAQYAPFDIFGDGSYLITPNSASAGFYNQNDSELWVFDLRSLEQHVFLEGNGPVRHDKADPYRFCTSVMNGSRQQNTLTWGGNTGISNFMNQRFPNRSWGWRDGPGRDALGDLNYGHAGASDHPNWAGKAYVVTGERAYNAYLGMYDDGPNARQQQIVRQIQPQDLTATTHEIRVRFTGTALRGYSPIYAGEQSPYEQRITLGSQGAG